MPSTSIVITEKEEWTTYIHDSFDFDFYHTWEYHAMDKRGMPVLFVYKDEDYYIALPLIKRKIEDSAFYDMTSVYGYTGPISNKSFEDFDESALKNFELSFKNFIEQEKSVSLFSRLNPFFKQNNILKNIGGIRSNGKTVYMDLSVPLEQQTENYNKRLLRQIRQLRKKNFDIKYTDRQEDIKTFTAMYTENMDRVGASSFYYFDEAYFTKLVQTKEFNNKLILIFNGKEAICGAIVTWSKYIIRNHLSATNKNYIKDSPSKLLTEEISMLGRRMGMKYFHLGGGVGGRDDSLLAFKLSFSPLYLDDHIWCYISDEQVYNSLVERNAPKAGDALFPLYRNVPNKKLVFRKS